MLHIDVISFCSYYPKYPSEIQVPFDFTYKSCMNFPDFSPDILITPSKLQRFVKTQDAHLCINPCHVVKSESAGTFAYLTIHPLNVTLLDADDPAIATKDPANKDPLFFHRATSRVRVDIIRI